MPLGLADSPPSIQPTLAGSSDAADDALDLGNLVEDHVLAGRGPAEELRRLPHPIAVGPDPRWETSVTVGLAWPRHSSSLDLAGSPLS